jgi:hypothetical protein
MEIIKVENICRNAIQLMVIDKNLFHHLEERTLENHCARIVYKVFIKEKLGFTQTTLLKTQINISFHINQLFGKKENYAFKRK